MRIERQLVSSLSFSPRPALLLCEGTTAPELQISVHPLIKNKAKDREEGVLITIHKSFIMVFPWPFLCLKGRCRSRGLHGFELWIPTGIKLRNISDQSLFKTLKFRCVVNSLTISTYGAKYLEQMFKYYQNTTRQRFGLLKPMCVQTFDL